MFKKRKAKEHVEEEREKIGWDDLIAIMIAQFQILFPLALAAVAIVSILVFLLLKVWLKQ